MLGHAYRSAGQYDEAIEVYKKAIKRDSNNMYAHMGLAFSKRRFGLPTGKLCPSGAGHIQFEIVLHGITSWIEVEWLVGS